MKQRSSDLEIFTAIEAEASAIGAWLSSEEKQRSDAPVHFSWIKKYLTQWSEHAERSAFGRTIIRDVFIPAHQKVAFHNAGAMTGKSFSQMMLNVLNGKHPASSPQYRSAAEFFAALAEKVRAKRNETTINVIQEAKDHASIISSCMKNGGMFPTREMATPAQSAALEYYVAEAASWQKIGESRKNILTLIFKRALTVLGAKQSATKSFRGFGGTVRIVLLHESGAVARKANVRQFFHEVVAICEKEIAQSRSS